MSPRRYLLAPAAAVGWLVYVAAATSGFGAATRQAPAKQEGVSITFLANEGVMLSSGTGKVLIDALFQKYETGYAVPADSTRAALEGARSPFDDVRLILVTHRHGDHVGDTDVTEAAFASFRLDTSRIDVALLPAWMVTSREGRRVIEKWIRPRQVFAFHVGEGEGREVTREVRASLPGAVTLVRSLETHRW